MRRAQQGVGPLQQVGRLRVHDGGDFFQELLRAGHQRRIDRGHLAGDHVFRGLERGPVIVGQPQGHFDVEDFQQLDEVVGPSGRYRAGAHSVFQRKVPADDPGEDFAHGGIGIRVRASRQRDHGGELGVTQAGERAPQSRQYKGQHQAGAGVVRAQARHHEDTRADNGADSQRGELEHAQGPLQAVFAGLPGFGQQHLERLANKKVCHKR